MALIRLRNQFSRKLGKAVETLEKSTSPIARFTAKMIHFSPVRIFPLKKITSAMVQGDSFYKGIRLSKKFLSKQSITQIRRRTNGFQDGEMVFLNETLSQQRLASVLVHEINHYLNENILKIWDKDNPDEFQEEFRAHIAVEIYKHGMIEARKKIDEVAATIEKNYDLTRPKKLNFPKTPFYVDIDNQGEVITSKSKSRRKSNRRCQPNPR